MEKKVIANFTLLSVREMPETGGELWQFEHERSGARLIWLKRDDENMTFGIGFRTTPEDDTGVFHILEHSVLCGSRRYPVKEPFVDLMKTSMNTFLNAITFPDKTVYPVSSRNEKDFINLVRVYMDAVLHPLIYDKPEIFYQEGWHHELTSADAEPTYKGVVFNEMKGAFSEADTIMVNAINRRLYPETTYRFVSGGDPEHIPDLTYEQFINSHRRFYHPSNSYIVLDGSVDIEKILGILDEEYLSEYERSNDLPEFVMQKPVKSGRITVSYEAPSGENVEKRSKLAWGMIYGDYSMIEEQTAVAALADALCGSNQAPLKKAMLDSRLVEDFSIRPLDGTLQAGVWVQADNIKEKDADEIEKLVFDKISDIAEHGLDRDQIRATLANMEFQMRERDYGYMPRGLIFGLSILDTWLYGGDPAAKLEATALFKSLDKKLDEGYFEKLLKKVFLESDHSCSVLLVPSLTLGDERRAKEADRLKRESAGWSAADRERIWKQQQNIDEWQSQEDSPEAKATLPTLLLSDISDKPEYIPTSYDLADSVPVVKHEINAGGISYVNLYFDVSDFTAEQLRELALICDVLDDLDTDKYPNLELQKQIRLLLGNVSFSIESYGKVNQPDKARAMFCVSFSATDEKLEKGAKLISHMLTSFKLDDKDKIRVILRQMITENEQRTITLGHSVSFTRIGAAHSAEGVMREYTRGYTYTSWIKETSSAFDANHAELIAGLKAIAADVLRKGRLILSVTGTNENAVGIIEREIIASLPDCERRERECVVKPWGVRKEGIAIPSDVCYAGLGGSLIDFGGEYSGYTKVYARISGLAYLWNAVRVQGGAYGVGLISFDSGVTTFYSFRDPQAVRSLGCYRQSCDFMDQFCAASPDITGLVIGTVAESDPLLLPNKKGKAADSMYFKGLSFDDLVKVRRQMLETTIEDLKRINDSVRAMMGNASVCVVGPRAQLEACGADVDTILEL